MILTKNNSSSWPWKQILSINKVNTIRKKNNKKKKKKTLMGKGILK
jgi:hypothetical protein